jgi:hypothetical protein
MTHTMTLFDIARRCVRTRFVAGLVALSASTAFPVSAQAPTAEPTLPLGVVLRPADEATIARGRQRLEALLADRTPATWSAAMSDAPLQGRASVMVGTFVALDLGDRTDFDVRRTHHGKGVVPLTPDIPVHYQLIGATTPAQRDYLAEQLLRILPTGAPDAIRPADFDELALIWYFIGWDLDEPLYVAQWGDRRFVFDFDPDGQRLTWVERLSKPCFAFGVENDDKTRSALTQCHCMSIARDGARWAARFQPSSCPK